MLMKTNDLLPTALDSLSPEFFQTPYDLAFVAAEIQFLLDQMVEDEADPEEAKNFAASLFGRMQELLSSSESVA